MTEDKTTPIIVIFEEHWVVGMVPNSGVRVLDILNDLSTDYLRLNDAQMFREKDRDRSVASVPEVVIPKEQIRLLVIPSREHEAPGKRRNTRVEKRMTEVMFVVPSYLVRGEIHLSSMRDDSLYTLASEVGTFFPITNATVECPTSQPINAPVVIANKAKVNCFCLGKRVERVPHPELASATEN